MNEDTVVHYRPFLAHPTEPPIDDSYDADAAESLGAPATAKKRFELVPFSNIEFSSGSRWLVKGLLAANGLTTIFGPPKQYKSFIAADVALHIASGRSWAGRRVRQGAVVYIAGEGPSGFSDRIAANRKERDYPADLPFFLIKARPNLGVGEGDTLLLANSIDQVISPLGIPLVAIFIDTLVRTLAGSSENDEGMRNFTDNAEAIADRFQCLAVAVHHTGKDATKGMRGSSALHGAVVTSWKVEKAADFQARITLEDAKDGESGLSWTADLERYVFRHDEDGDEESVLLVRNVSDPVADAKPAITIERSSSQRVPPQLKLFVSCLEEVIASQGRPEHPFSDGPEIKVVALAAVRDAYYKSRGDDASPEAKRKACEYNQKTGVERQLFLIQEIEGEKVIWPVRREGATP